MLGRCSSMTLQPGSARRSARMSRGLVVTVMAVGTLVSVALTTTTTAGTAAAGYRELGIKPTQVLSGTSLEAKVVPGEGKQFVMVTSYLTGTKKERYAVNVRLDVFQDLGNRLIPVYTRDFGEEQDGFVGDGDLQVFDLDRDGIAEIVVTFRRFHSPVIDERHAEVIGYGADGFRTRWVGPFEYDATKAVREVPEERRDRFRREIDLEATLRSRASELHLDKQVIAIAGERLATPRNIDEVFPLQSP